MNYFTGVGVTTGTKGLAENFSSPFFAAMVSWTRDLPRGSATLLVTKIGFSPSSVAMHVLVTHAIIFPALSVKELDDVEWMVSRPSSTVIAFAIKASLSQRYADFIYFK
jgi:hypothetical protein